MTKWANAVPSRAEQQDTKRKAIIREAARCFNRRGSHGTTLEDVAERLGVTKTALYRYVNNKNDLLCACHEEAMEIADRIVVMSHGRIEQVGKPSEIYENPANPFVCEFLGNANRIPLTWANGKMSHPAIDLDAITVKPRLVGAEHVFVRPHDIHLVKDSAGAGTVRFLSIVGPVVSDEIKPSAASL